MMSEPLAFLRERIAEAIGGRRNAMAFADQTGGRFTRKTLQRWIDGETWPDFAELVGLAEASGKPLTYFLPPNLPEPSIDVVKIPVLDIKAAAGAGHSADVVKATGELALPIDFVRKIAPAGAELSCLRCAGDSMAPTVQDNAMLIIDGRQNKLRPFRAPSRKSPRERQRPDDIFVFIQSGDLRLKRLRDVGDGLVAILSDNSDHAIEIFKPGRDGALAIIGKLIWWDNRL